MQLVAQLRCAVVRRWPSAEGLVPQWHVLHASPDTAWHWNASSDQGSVVAVPRNPGPNLPSCAMQTLYPDGGAKPSLQNTS